MPETTRKEIKNFEKNMKAVILFDGDDASFEEMVDTLNHKKPRLVHSAKCDESQEYEYLTRDMDYFFKSDDDIMLVKFSGKDSISKNLGEERSEMIITLSNKKNSKYYMECPKQTFVDLLNILN